MANTAYTDGSVNIHGQNANGDWIISSTKPLEVNGKKYGAGQQVNVGKGVQVQGTSKSTTTTTRGGRTTTRTRTTRGGNTSTSSTTISSSKVDKQQAKLHKKMHGY